MAKASNVKTTEIKKSPAGRKKKEYNYTFHLTQEELGELEIFCPLSIKQETYLNDNENDIVVWGGAASAGKTQLSLLRLMLAGMWDEHYVAGVARSSQKQMKMAGSLWSTGIKLFQPYGISSNKIESSWAFPSGAEVKCHHLYNNQDDWHGSQMTECLVDEAQQCLEDDVWFLTSRLRSRSKRKHQLRLTCNPLNTSFLCRWLLKAGYVGEDGLPVKEMDGVTTFMLQINGAFEWYKDRKEIEELYGKDTAAIAQKFVFYSANVYDNPYIRKHQPGYVHKLENLKSVERRRYLLGDWLAKLDNEGYIRRDWFIPVQWSDIPLDIPKIRCYDLASTKPSPANKDPDWTRGVKCSYDKTTGNFYILSMCSMRDRPAMVQNLIEQTAQADGKDVFIGIPIDAGSSGRTVADEKRARLVGKGFKVILNPTRKSKLQRAEPFLIALQAGKVFVAPGVFEDQHYEELENFDGAKCNGYHEDILDAISDCWKVLTTSMMVPTIRLGKDLTKIAAIGGKTLL